MCYVNVRVGPDPVLPRGHLHSLGDVGNDLGLSRSLSKEPSFIAEYVPHRALQDLDYHEDNLKHEDFPSGLSG